MKIMKKALTTSMLLLVMAMIGGCSSAKSGDANVSAAGDAAIGDVSGSAGDVAVGDVSGSAGDVAIGDVSGSAGDVAIGDASSNAGSGTDASSADSDDPGTLVQVEYSYSSATMRGSDFGIAVNKDKIIASTYFDEDDKTQKEKNDAPITSEQWKQIEDAVDAIVPVIEEVSSSDAAAGSDANAGGLPIQPLDGLDSSTFALTWDKDGVSFRVIYRVPADRRFSTLKDILMETVDPIGREIEYYEEPVAEGMYFRRKGFWKKNKYSWQCTKHPSLQDKYMFIEYYYENGKQIHVDENVGEDVQKRIMDKCAELGILNMKKGAKESEPICTMIMSDMTQPRYQLDEKSAKEFDTFLREIAEQYR